MAETREHNLEDVEIAGDAEAASTDNANLDGSGAARRSAPSKKRFYLGLAAALLVVILVVVIPTAVVKSTGHSSSASSLQEENSDGTETDSSGGSIRNNLTDTEPFPTSLQSFGQSVVQGYSSSDELATDIMSAGEFVLNQVVKRNLNYEGYDGVGFGRANPNAFSGNKGALDMPEADAGAPTTGDSSSTTTTGGGSDVANDLTDYGTNNQEDNIEEGDVVVSDGNLLYIAYGDYVVVANPRTGEEVVKFRMPSNRVKSPGVYPVTGGPAIDLMPYYWPQVSVRSLVIDEASKRLLVVADGYASQSIQELNGDATDSSNMTLPVIFEYLGTHIRVYDTDSLASGDTEPLFTEKVHGYFNGVRVIDGIAHLMTMSGLDVYTNLIAPFERDNFPNLSDVQYLKKAQKKAAQALETFTDKLMEDLTVQDGSLPDLARISLYTNAEDATAELLLPNGPINTYAQIASFDLTSNALDLSLAGSFIPDYSAQFYAASNALVVAGQGSRFLKRKNSGNNSSDAQTSVDTTYFLSFSLDGTKVTPHSVGKVDGYLLNSYAIDVVDDLLRVAVTVRENTWWWRIPIDEPIALSEPTSGMSDSATASDSSGTTSNDGGRLRRVLQDNGIAVGEPDPNASVDSGKNGSSTEIYIIILQMPGSNGTDPGKMVELGRVKLGKPDESITAVRFFNKVAFAVTFEQRDPLYAVDLKKATAPTVVGELDVTGFSSYLIPIKADNSLILSIGQEANENGTVTGMKLSIYNVTVLSDPHIIQELVLENDPNSNSWSDALWDFKAARYAGGRLIIPMDVYDWFGNGTNNMHGYIVFKADETGIEEECRINQGVDQMYATDVCYYCAWLPRRSMIFDADLVTLNDHFISSTDMQTCSLNWETLITAGNGTDGSGMGCCGLW